MACLLRILHHQSVLPEKEGKYRVALHAGHRDTLSKGKHTAESWRTFPGTKKGVISGQPEEVLPALSSQGTQKHPRICPATGSSLIRPDAPAGPQRYDSGRTGSHPLSPCPSYSLDTSLLLKVTLVWVEAVFSKEQEVL